MSAYLLALQPQYIKKSDAKHFAKKKRKFLSIFVFVGIVTSLLIGLFFIPIINHSPTLSIVSPISYLSIFYALIGLFLSFYFLVTEPNYKKLDEKLKQYPGEKVLAEKIATKEDTLIPLCYFFLPLAPLVYFIVINAK